MAGAVCGRRDLVQQLTDVNSGALMLLGPTLDSLRAASLMKNLHSLHIRMQKHSANALYVAEKLAASGLQVSYLGLPAHPQHGWLARHMNPGYGYGGMLLLDAGSEEQAGRLLARLQQEKSGYLAVSLGYFRTLFSPSGNSTSSEIPKTEQQAMRLSESLIRFSIGLDHDIARSWRRLAGCLRETGLI